MHYQLVDLMRVLESLSFQQEIDEILFVAYGRMQKILTADVLNVLEALIGLVAVAVTMQIVVISLGITNPGNVDPVLICTVFPFVVMHSQHSFLAVMLHPLFLMVAKNVDLYAVDDMPSQVLRAVAWLV